ncbi:MAG TPA: hypothetical protein VOA87_05975 [Thermoanaerobaculia bacterium]|nr:hypothetical protein [Thermoanaerobaculia bacterium]
MSLPPLRRRHARPVSWSTLLLLAVLSWPATAHAAALCPNCNCEWSADCAIGQTCAWPSNCRVWYANGLKIDGTCTSAGAAAIGAEQEALAAQALDSWLQAYERAGIAGGEPDSALVADAFSLPLTPAQHGAIRRAALQVETILFGLTGAQASLAANDAVCISDTGAAAVTADDAPALANGTLPRLGADDFAAAAIVRAAVTAELLRPFHGDFARIMARIPRELPRFAASGVCADARADGRFPYKDSLDCLHHELLRSIHSLLPRNGGEASPRGGFLAD